MLVRARRLVFGEIVNGNRVSTLGLYSVFQVSGLWGAKVWTQNLCSLKDTEQEAIDACQEDFDARWLAGTEVMPLEWEDIDSEGRYCMAETTICEYYVDQKGSGFVWYVVRSVNDDCDGHQPCDSRDHGKQLCEEHHRKLVLGE